MGGPLNYRDLDETRRLLYVVLYAPMTANPEIVGSLVNALAHYGVGVDPEVSAPAIIARIDGGSGDWLRRQIDAVTALADKVKPRSLPPSYD